MFHLCSRDTAECFMNKSENVRDINFSHVKKTGLELIRPTFDRIINML